ncbi:phenazine-specific anthranilate synthase component I [Lentzea sp. NBRC 105346]|uniref:anthranilate synthase family protein n=1 Tax=Lentzea sp. NBRC 105346 TaxID=3032205 RepID=UPI0024A13ECB|nr:chorismate-binding protein [Lentzea sp. NBRC 105346]GLZ29316.1 phenazine-specific anthranilate synthase component I [Lentzea sp. NBRC 105346]
MTAEFTSLLARVLYAEPGPFVLLHRPEAVGDRVELLTGDVAEYATLADLPLPEPVAGQPRHELFALVPYRQIGERGFECHDDGAPLLGLTVREQMTCSVADAQRIIPATPITLSGGGFEPADEEYAEIVDRVLAAEIGHGAGANFVIKRAFTADVTAFTPRTAAGLFSRLLAGERGAYWTFVVHTGERTFVGATPERHVSLFDSTALMNPISGTFRYAAEGPKLSDLMAFLRDAKETGELYMVLDEELKMMGRITERGGRAVGPFLKEMATLAHTEYLIEGRTTMDVRDILRETMFAPTVTGSPVESACRVIREYEPHGRGYYSGVAALISHDVNGGRSLDSAILLRTAEITGDRLAISVGATLVRDSDPASEVAETRAKARGMLRALGVEDTPSGGPVSAHRFGDHPDVRAELTARNSDLARFWLDRPAPDELVVPALAGKRTLVVDAEDTFTSMLGHQLRALGLEVEVASYADACPAGHDLVVMGPGPGDPRAIDHPKIAALRAHMRSLLDTATPFLAVCLSHQVLGGLLGFETMRRESPNQGVQHEIDFFGRRVGMGFYNTFALHSPSDEVACPGVVEKVAVSRDPLTGEVHGLHGPGFRSTQFHMESVLSPHGLDVLSELVTSLLEVDRCPSSW